ncbi:MAG TPA: fatty acyl-AMP ligase [Alphaproteobacteria bacterium]|nr:fatty acyl-AMP ligase [Alphaproteobacteria bacterium]
MARDLAPVQAGEPAFRGADFSTLAEALDYAAAGSAGAQFYSARGDLLEVLTYRDLQEQSRSLARRMLRAGLAVGDRVALLAETDGNFLRAFFACQYAGLVAVPLPLPAAFGGRSGYVDHIRRMLAVAKASAILSPRPFLDMVRESAVAFDPRTIGTFDLFDSVPDDRRVELPDISPDTLSYLQFSSGSTRSPAGIAVTQRALMANLRGIAQDALQIRADDRCVSWLPFYHDMGLVGFLLAPVATQVPVDYIATREFARRPLIWPTIIARNGGTLSYSPSFGYDLCARRLKDGAAADLDLSKWRVAGIGGDMIRPKVLSRFAEAFAASGFRKEAFVASYGMAEATLGIAFAPLNRGIELDNIDLDRLEQEARAVPANDDHRARTRAFVLCGQILPGHEVEIRAPNGASLPDRRVGRIMFRGPSLMREYFDSRDETARVLTDDGWLDTGDLGFFLDGSLVVTGRSKDLILANGRNIWPQDLEWLVEHDVEGVRNGDVAAFSVDQAEAENIILLVQCRATDQTMRASLRQTVADTVRAAAGVDCSVVLVPHNSLPQTSSGKLSRARARQMYLDLLRTEPSNDQMAPAFERYSAPATL